MNNVTRMTDKVTSVWKYLLCSLWSEYWWCLFL